MQCRQRPQPHKCCIRLQRIVYLRDVFSPPAFERVKEACRILHPHLEKENGFAIGRRYVSVSKDSYLHSLFYDKGVMARLGSMIGTRCLRVSQQPIEYREYTVNSSMPWHRDVKLTESCPQIEVVFTVYNTSDSMTEWIDEQNHDKLESIRSQANSMIITQGLGALHQVTTLTKGERAIVKIAYNLSP